MPDCVVSSFFFRKLGLAVIFIIQILFSNFFPSLSSLQITVTKASPGIAEGEVNVEVSPKKKAATEGSATSTTPCIPTTSAVADSPSPLKVSKFKIRKIASSPYLFLLFLIWYCCNCCSRTMEKPPLQKTMAKVINHY